VSRPAKSTRSASASPLAPNVFGAEEKRIQRDRNQRPAKDEIVGFDREKV
jgi:hypothetical protein